MFPPFYVITLAEDSFRKNATAIHLSDAGVCPMWLQGFYGPTIGLRSAVPYAFDKNGNPEYITNAQLAIALTHIFALRFAVADQPSEFVIAEDDIEVDPDIKTQWEQIRKQIPEDCGIVNLEFYPSDEAKVKKVTDGLYEAHQPWCASCIWWRRDTAISALQMLRPIDRPFDQMLMQMVYPFHKTLVCDLVRQRTRSGQWHKSVG